MQHAAGASRGATGTSNRSAFVCSFGFERISTSMIIMRSIFVRFVVVRSVSRGGLGDGAAMAARSNFCHVCPL
eukprot:2734519-Prymnesium_polylepis.1